MLAVIGGSGFEKFEEFEAVNLVDRETPFGLASSGFKKVRVDGKEFLFISRHGEHHEHLPSEVNYRANIFALKKNGARGIISFSSVGSLQKELKPGDLVISNQYIDRTKGVRASSFLGQGLVGHVSLAKPTCEVMERALKTIFESKRVLNIGIESKEFKFHFDRVHVCIEGPYFSTKAESLAYKQSGADIIGMTNFPEYALAREAGLPYLPCCWITDYDCWDDGIPHVTVQEVLRVMRLNNSKAFQILREFLALESPWAGSLAPDSGLRTSLFMPPERVPPEKQKWLKVLLA